MKMKIKLLLILVLMALRICRKILNKRIEGKIKINKIEKNKVTNCSTFDTRPKLCKEEATCGWCRSSKKCLSGNEKELQEQCDDKPFRYK